ncbi:AzlD domain-containing protein [Bacillus solimangrovi]|uniref:Branched-chain amino acid transporter n=1 Tax=Bacillus solimangrovi TaxID=1305675 RepID=A0A1E5LED3_9BACI|nr:AzlD domain-containing protein [Bacillus solimangrovi]OEH92419.1 branched-chain amino acid transporter [Bacillus solimangrovi]
MDLNILLTILGMAIVTYIPRALPFLAFDVNNLNPFVKGVLQNVPYAALGALIVPGVFFIQPNDIWFGIIGVIAAFLSALLGANVIVVVVSSIGVLTIYSYLF